MHLIIHHWDTDGITSAALLVRALEMEGFTNMTAPIGEFRFDERIWEAVEKTERLYVLDFNVPGEVEKVNIPTLFIDHHTQPRIKNPLVEQVNPSLGGEYYPSCSLVVSEHFGIWNAWSALGVVGDIGKKAFELDKVRKLLEREGISREDALRLVELIDSNYIAMEREAVGKAVEVLLSRDLKELLEYEPWVKKVEAIREAIEGAVSNAEERDGFAIVHFESPFNVISKVARKLVWELGYRGAVVINGNFHGKGQVYFRISAKEAEMINVAEIIERVRALGANAGGKREVLGCICGRDKISEVMAIIEEYLR
ncbi:DHH family phosphoesterase [Thermococcus thioreducens]|uniref:DHH family protein n=1 Tax=Thermococcus thioreducens TaxID=277988 RepID=A0A0Q2UME2_9EURY|nr:DHH family phosphoesterase [Thermococcus thioreducens]ASJ11587.1 DHH family protein [Thermococcus thioreducens]KQH81808.1 DHH family protein [Thermococcus thioreducens]SEW03931.1 Single-stranded DNA-specific exonuclease, DHH superfamily, may be involved in DNA replication intiation [Thermococcus thioreducens]